ncbi:MAG: D-cysteine desulfhydrase family protein [Polyangiaceae bacterium]
MGTLCGCSDRIPDLPTAERASQVFVRFDRSESLLAGVPWPNDALTWSRGDGTHTPIYPNVPVVGVDARIATWLESVNATPGWSPTSSISLPFARSDGIAAGPAIDLANLLVAQRDSDFANDAIYVIDLETGLPVPLDFDKHLTSFVLNREVALDPSDTKRDSTSLLVETEDERYDSVSFTFNPTRTDDGTIQGAPLYRSQWDRDSDGTLDVPLYEAGQPCSPGDRKTATERAEHGACQADNLIPFYDVASNRLRIKPRRPLRENTTYAVVVTHRLLDNADPRHPVGSPFPQPFPPSQEKTAKRLRAIFSTEGLEPFYGTLRQSGLEGVSFLWSFTTASPVSDLRQIASSIETNETRLEFRNNFDLDQSCGGSSLREVAIELLTRTHRLSPGERAALNADLADVSRIYTGNFAHPRLLGGAGATLRLLGESTADMNTAPFLVTIPARHDGSGAIPLVIGSHDTNTNRLDGLRWAGQLARFGLGVVMFDHLGSAKSAVAAEDLVLSTAKSCTTDFVNALLSQRTDATRSDGRASTIFVVSTRERWRASAIEHWLLAQAVERERYVQAPSDGFRVVGYVGQGEGGAIVSLASTLPNAPEAIVVVDPMTNPARAWARGTTWRDADVSRLSVFGPRIVGVSPERREDLGLASRCSASEASIRMYSAEDASAGEHAPGIEQGCLPLIQKNEPRFLDGATVIVTNLETLARRCVGMTTQGDFSLGIPAVESEPLELVVHSGMDAVTRLGRNEDCRLVETTKASVFRLADDASTSKSNPQFHASGSGLGIERQSEEFRLALDWANQAFGFADPLAFLAHESLRQPGTAAPATLLVVSPGNPNVGPDEGVGAAVAIGLVPQLPDDALSLHPSLAADTTPSLLANALRRPTAEIALSVSHIAEGVPRLMRHDPEPLECGVNRADDETLRTVCEPTCVRDLDCPTDTTCREGTCKTTTPSVEMCAMSLADADALAGALAGTRTEVSLQPLRLARYAGMATVDNLPDLWQPRMSMNEVGEVDPVHPGWALSVLALPLTHPLGAHGIPNDDICQRFRFGTYVPNLLADFLTSGGSRYAPISIPNQQTCLAEPDAWDRCRFPMPTEMVMNSNRLPLAHLPTPLQHFPALDELVGCEVWLKRDDFNAGAAAGNKIRKLELLLADALHTGATDVVTCGGEQSNHARATALCAAQLGLETTLLLRTEQVKHPPATTGNILLDRLAGAKIRWITAKEYEARDELLASEAARLRAEGRVPYVIPEGGSNGLGALGYVEAMREVRQQLDHGLAGRIRHFDSIVVACGSGGTAAGVALGARHVTVANRVDAIAVTGTESYFRQITDRIIVDARALDDGLGATVPLHIHDQYRGPAYAVASTEQLAFIVNVARKTGIVLDPVYTGKALFGLSQLPERPSRALFIHTGGLPGALAEVGQLEPALV